MAFICSVTQNAFIDYLLGQTLGTDFDVDKLTIFLSYFITNLFFSVQMTMQVPPFFPRMQ